MTAGVHAAATALLVIAVVAVAYGSEAPSLGVAEFAPAAQSQLEAPPTTAAESARSAGGGGRRSTTTVQPAAATTSSVPSGDGSVATTRVGRARRCYGNPPRQAADPLSPACLATIYEGDNGGASTRGVTGTEIRVAVPIQFEFGGGFDQLHQSVVSALFDHFNAQFELYGRRLVPVFVTGAAADAGDAPKARAVAQEIAAKSVFGALVGTLELFGGYPQPALASGLAANGVVTVVHNKSAWWTDRLVFDALHPFLWSVYPASEQLQPQLGAAACALASEPARDVQRAPLGPRRYGIVAVGQQLPPKASAIADMVEVCTGSRPSMSEVTVLAGTANPTALRPTVEQMAANGVTTIICVCERTTLSVPIQAAVAAGKTFEFLYPQSADFDGDEWLGGARFDLGQRKNPLYAVTHGLRVEPPQNHAWFPIVAGSPAFVGNGTNLEYTFRIAEAVYPQLLVLASGVQAAGPTLTPETFAAGLQTSVFPNSEANQAPLWWPSVGFGPGDHGFFDDFGLARWDPTMPAVTPSALGPMGSWCYVGGGQRFQPDAVPMDLDARLFSGPCR